MRKTPLVAFAMAAALALPAAASTLSIGSVERLQYSWSLRGPLSWVARIAIPVSGRGTLETTTAEHVSSRLTMTAPNSTGQAFYASRMSADGVRTFASSDGYSWRDRSELQKVTFDFQENVARVEKRDGDGIEKKVRKLSTDTPQDVLTSIFYLRRNAEGITAPMRAQVYSGGKPYDFVFTPQRLTDLTVNGRSKRVRPFLIEPADGSGKGSVRVWLTADSERVPVRIEIEQKHATLRLDLVG